MAYCRKCGRLFDNDCDLIDENGGKCPECGWEIKYNCWKCKKPMSVKHLQAQGISTCKRCHYWVCPDCGAHGRPCNPQAPLSDWQLRHMRKMLEKGCEEDRRRNLK